MADITERVKMGFSEIRTLVLGAQILLGFQYEALFQPRFERLAGHAQVIEGCAYLLLFAAVVLLLAPVGFHRLAERGDATAAQCRVVSAMSSAALAAFAAAMALNVALVIEPVFGRASATALGAGALALALFLWFGLELMRRRPPLETKMSDKKSPLDQRISQMMTEARIVLPGVQALLGFQFAAYLTEAFDKLPPASKLAHTASLLFLLVAMILLMTPAPFHRLAERGEMTPRLDRVGVAFVLSALIPLALGLGGDAFVVLAKVSGRAPVAGAIALSSVIAALLVWFGWPLAMRTNRDRGAQTPLPAE